MVDNEFQPSLLCLLCFMGKAINELYDAFVEIKMDYKLFWDKSFMNKIFSMIHTSD